MHVVCYPLGYTIGHSALPHQLFESEPRLVWAVGFARPADKSSRGLPLG